METNLAFKKTDVIRFKKGLEDGDVTKWLKIANKKIKELVEAGTGILEAEVEAVRAANASFSDAEIIGLNFSDMQEHEELRLAEVAGNSDDFQLVIPIGTTYDDWYGEIILTRTFMDAMVKNQHALKKTKPFLNEQHDRGKALGWASEIRASDEGLEVKWDFTKLGRGMIEDEIYKYYSGEITGMRDRDTGEQIYPVFGGAALTNSPVMKGMPQAHLSTDIQIKADGPKHEGEESMDFSKIKEETLNLSDSEKSELVLALGFENRDNEVTDLADKVEALAEVNSTLKDQNISLSAMLKEIDDEKVEGFLLSAIAEGKIKPADKDAWTGRLTKDFTDYSQIINDLPVIVDLSSPVGSGQDSENEKDFAELADEFTGKKKGDK